MANYFDATARLPQRYRRVDPWGTRFFNEDPFAQGQQRSLAQVQNYWSSLAPDPQTSQRHPEHEALRNKAYADAIAFHDSNHQKVYQQAPIEQVPSQSLIDSMTKAAAPAATQAPPTAEPQVQQPAAQTQLPRFSDGTPYTPTGGVEGSGMYKDFNPNDPYQTYLSSVMAGMGRSAFYNPPAATNRTTPGTIPGLMPSIGAAQVPLGDPGIIGGLRRDPALGVGDPLLGSTNVDPYAQYVNRSSQGRY